LNPDRGKSFFLLQNHQVVCKVHPASYSVDIKSSFPSVKWPEHKGLIV